MKMKFNVGDRLVYPFHGAGVVAAIEVHEVLKELREYYVLSFEHIRLKLNVPTDSIDKLGIRHLISREEVPKIFSHFHNECNISQISWNKRNREIIEKLRSADIYREVEVYKFLRLRELSKQLSTGEKKLLVESGNAIISEISLVMERSFAEIQKQIDDIIYSISKEEV